MKVGSSNSPIILMYIQEMGRMAALPKGAADTVRFVLVTTLSPSPPGDTNRNESGEGEVG